MNFFGAHIDRVYFLGIGGIGMSALARYFHREGVQVSGYDRSASVVTQGLAEAGITIFHHEDVAHLQEQDLIVYTPAMPEDSLELQAAMASDQPLHKRSVVLGEISRHFRTLAVAGTHGKTTTSTMLAHLLRHSGIDATAFLGGISRNLAGNFAYGNAPWMVTEADEYDRSFLQLHPHTAILTSLDPDHLDIYGSAEEMIGGYVAFATQCSHLLVHSSVAATPAFRHHPTYGVEAGDHRAENLRPEGMGVRFDYRDDKHRLQDLYLPAPGRHNVSNLTAALALALRCGAAESALAAAVSSYRGIYRRYEVHLHSEALSYVDDYAHHPTEIEAAITAAREYLPGRQVVVVFQPHLYSRTRDFAAGFAEALSRADEVLLMDIYPAREKPIAGISSETILAHLPAAKGRLVSREALATEVEDSLALPSVVLSLGAGDIDCEIEGFRRQLQTIAMTSTNSQA